MDTAENQTCCTCKRTKNLNEFHKSKYENSGRRRRCKECSSTKAKESYEKDPDKVKRRVKEWERNRVEENRRVVWNYLSTHPCIGCGEDNPIVLEFDHRNPSEKVNHVSRLVSFGRNSIDVILAEITKCDVLCANCHRIKTASQFGYWKLAMLDT